MFPIIFFVLGTQPVFFNSPRD